MEGDVIGRFDDRDEARIAFARNIRNFQVARGKGARDILYLEVPRDKWYRAEITCFGTGDPRFAHGLVPLSHGSGFNRYSRVRFVGVGGRHERSDCTIRSLVELTEDEAIEFNLVRQGSVPEAEAAS